MLIRVKVVEKVKILEMEKCSQQGVGQKTSFKTIQHHGSQICTIGGHIYEHGNLGEIQCI
jgi:hypothetical protein